MKNKKVLLSVLSTAVVASMASSAFAANPGFYVGGDIKHYYSLDAMFAVDGAKVAGDFENAGVDNIVYVDENGSAANLGAMFNEPTDPLDALTDVETAFGENGLDEYTTVKEDGTDGDVVVPVDGPTVSDVTSAIDGSKATIAGNAANATSVEVTVFKGTDKVAAKSVDVADNKFSVDFTDLAAGDYTYEVIASNADEDSQVKTGSFKVEAPAELKVDSVSAINGKQLEVKFSNSIDPTTVTVNNFTVTQTGDAAGTDRVTSATSTNAIGTAGTGSVVLAEDGKTVVITLDNRAALANPTTATVYVTGVKDSSGKVITDVAKTASFADSTVATVDSVTAIGSNQVRVLFTEPVLDTADVALDAGVFAPVDFVVDNGAMAVQTVVRDANNAKALIVTTTGNFTAGNHTIRVNPAVGGTLQDYANYRVVQVDKTFTYTADTSVPTVSAEARNERTVRLTFSKPVQLSAATANVNFRYAYNAAGALSVNSGDVDAVTGGAQTFAAAAVVGSNNTKYDLTFASPFNPGTGTLYINYTTDTNAAGRIVDTYGNALPNNTAVNFAVSADATPPTVTGTTVVNATTIDVTYSEAVTGANVATNYTLTAPNGTNVAVQNAVQRGTTNTYRLTVASMATGGNYTLAVNNNIRDTSVSQNRLAPFSTTLAVADLQAPTVAAGAVTTNGARDKIYVQYSEPMATTGTNSAVSLANYRTSDAGGVQSALPTGTTITQNGNVVVISLPSSLAATQINLVIGQVADIAGNTLTDLQTIRLIGAGAVIPAGSVDQVRAKSDTTLTFRVARQLSGVNAALLTINATPSTNATFVNNADGTATVTATFPANTITTDLSGIVSFNLAANALTDTNTLGNAVDAVLVANIRDDIAPSLGAITTLDSNGDGQLDQATVQFSEDLYVASVQESDFTVAGYTITGVRSVVNGGAGTPSVVTLDLQPKATPDTGVTPDVTLVGAVQDNTAQRNQLGAQAAVTAVDGARPVITAVALGTDTGTAGNWDAVGDQLVVTFSENVALNVADPASVTQTELRNILGHATVAFAAGPPASTVAATVNGNSVTFTVAGAVLGTGVASGDAINGTDVTATHEVQDDNGLDLDVNGTLGTVTLP